MQFWIMKRKDKKAKYGKSVSKESKAARRRYVEEKMLGYKRDRVTKVLNETLKARQAALRAAQDVLSSVGVARQLVEALLTEGHDHAEDLYEGDQERTKGNCPHVVAAGNTERRADGI